MRGHLHGEFVFGQEVVRAEMEARPHVECSAMLWVVEGGLQSVGVNGDAVASKNALQGWDVHDDDDKQRKLQSNER